jgi:hypothetical protein
MRYTMASDLEAEWQADNKKSTKIYRSFDYFRL